MKLRKLRVSFAILFGALTTLLFLDFTGTVHLYFGWMAKIQFLPALFALNAGIILLLLALTLLFGRVYCSVICPLGVFQDGISKIASKHKKNRFKYSPAISWLRYGMLAVLTISFVIGLGSLVAFFEPYSTFGRIVAELLSPLYKWANNGLAYIAERTNSYTFYDVDIWLKSIGTLAVAILTLVVIFVLAWRSGRTYCNTICPTGTILGFVSNYSIYKHRFNTEKCNSCGLCARNCKASCMDSKAHTVDYSRCVSCYNCIGICNKSAIEYKPYWKTKKAQEQTPTQESNNTRRKMLTISALALATAALKAQKGKVDGGLAYIEDKQVPRRKTRIVPAGAKSLNNFSRRCTACQLCVSVCPNQVLRPSSGITNFMQPEMSYEHGYCRPECTKCAEVCPAGAISPINKEDKSSTQIGHAVWIQSNCVVLTDGVKCGNCARHCPVGAITMIETDSDDFNNQEIPMINTERCIGCGACEQLCPARPFTAIYVEGHLVHKEV